jgi:hypothetical protein
MAGRYKKPVQYGRESAHKSSVAGGNASLDNCMQREQHHQGDIGYLQRAWDKSAAVDSGEPNSKGILLHLRHLCATDNSTQFHMK